jgi:hypothetical protein
MINPYIEEAVRRAFAPPPARSIAKQPGATKPQQKEIPGRILPEQRRDQPTAVDLTAHISSVVGLVQTLVAMALWYRESTHDGLAAEIRRLVYSLATHLGRLARQPGAGVGPPPLQEVREALEKIGVPDWSPGERVTWCRKCGHDPVYSLWRPECDVCGWLKCPKCEACRMNCRGYKGKADSAPTADTGTRSVDGDDTYEIPF